MDKVTIDDFAKLEFKVGTVLEAEEIEGSEKLLKLSVDLGEETPRQVLSGIKLYYKPEDIKGKQFVFITNLEPRKMMGLESQAMIMAADAEGDVVLLIPEKEVPAGSKIR
jgi:methionyl-tRNA synthetase